MSLRRTLSEVRACQICSANLPFDPRPVLQMGSTARLLIISQAPGRKVHESGIPWNDASGDRLRDWLQLDRSAFYDAAKVAFLPMGLCYPGAGESGSDKPPRPECAPLWHERLLRYLPDVQLTLLIGQFAQQHHLASTRKRSMTETVKAFADYTPQYFPLPHPSWRSTGWMRKNSWFGAVTIPELRKVVREAV